MYPQRGRQATVSLKPAIFIYLIHLLQPGVRVPDFATRDKPEMPTSEITAENRIRALTNGTLLLVSRPASAAIPTLLGSPATPEGTQPENRNHIQEGSPEILLRRLSRLHQQGRPHVNAGHLPKPLRCLWRALRVHDHPRRLATTGGE